MKEYREERSVKGAESVISYTLVRKKVKNINMRINREGRVTVSAPSRVSKAYIDDLVISKEKLVIKLLRENEERQARRDSQPCLLYGEDIFEQVCKTWYPLLRNNYEIPYPVIQVRKMKSKWGTCYTTKEKIILNRALLSAPLKAIEYVVVHELAHFVHANHSPAFYKVIEEIMPDWKERRGMLKNL